MDERDLDRRLSELEARLGKIERRLGMVEPARAIAPEFQLPPALPPFAQPAKTIASEMQKWATAEPPKPIAAESIAATREPVVQLPPPLPTIDGASKHIMNYLNHRKTGAAESAANKESAPKNSLEQTIGLKWTGWIGAIVLLIGAALGVRYVYDQGWMHAVPYGVWLGIIFAAGIGLIGIGEWVYRKINVISAASLFGAGVATLFLAGYAGHAYYHLYGQLPAFVLMAVATLIGAAVARRGNLVSIAVLSIVGGNITPVLIHSPNPNLPGFFCYLGMLQLVAVILAHWGNHPKWWALRGLSLATTAGWMAAAATGNLRAMPTVPLALGAGIWFAAVYQLEFIWTTARRGGAAPWQTGTAFSLFVTAGLTALGLVVLPQDEIGVRVIFVLAEATACAVMGLMTRKNLARLSTSFSVQTFALVTLAIPVGLAGDSVIVGWAMLALAMAALGKFPGQQIARAAGPAVWTLGTLDWILRMSQPNEHPALHAEVFSIFHTAIRQGLLLGWMLAISGEIVAWLTMPAGESDSESQKNWTRIAWELCAFSAGIWIAASTMQLPDVAGTIALIAFAWACAIVDIATIRLRYVLQAGAMLMIALVKWAVIDALSARLSGTWVPDQHPLFNPIAGVGFALAVSIVAIYFLRRTSIHFWIARKAGAKRQADFAFGLACVIIGLLTFNFCLQVDDLMQLSAALPWPTWQAEMLSFTLIFCAAIAALWLAGAWADRQTNTTSRSLAIATLAGLLPMKYVLVDMLWWDSGHSGVMLLLNLSTVTAAAVTAVILGTNMLSVQTWRLARPTPGAVGAGIFTICWAGNFEILRAVDHGMISSWGVWDSWQLLSMLLTAWWTIGIAGQYLLVPKLRSLVSQITRWRNACAIMLILSTIKYLLIDTLAFRFLLGTKPAADLPFANPQVLEAVLLAASLGFVCVRHLRPSRIPLIAGFFMMMTMLWCGSMEVDRIFVNSIGSTFADPELARQVALSIFWSIFAVAAVFVGFRFQAAAMRYFGLALFAATLFKVVFVDMGQVSAGYRFLSFLGLGGLLMGTSVIYGKAGKAMLGDAAAKSTSAVQ